MKRPERGEQEKKHDPQWTEKRAERNEGDKGGNNRPIMGVTEDDRSCESWRRRSLILRGWPILWERRSRFTKSRNSAYGGCRAHSSSSSSSFSSSLSFLLPRRRGGTIGQTGCHNPLLFSHTLAVLCLCVSPCTFLVPVDERSLALSLLHPCQLMSHRVQRLRWPTFSVMFLSSACLPLPLSTIVLSRLPGWIDRWLELLR